MMRVLYAIKFDKKNYWMRDRGDIEHKFIFYVF